MKKLHNIFAIIFIAAIHVPLLYGAPVRFAIENNTSTIDPTTTNSSSIALKMYDSLHLSAKGLSESAFSNAIKGFQYLTNKLVFSNAKTISIIDFTKPSYAKRLFVIDLKSYKILFNTYVAHGQGSGDVMATKFSNVPESLQSSIGFYKTENTYIGKNGFSLKLIGLEKGINDRAEERAIVMHGASYVSEEIAQHEGHIGRSWGCPAVSQNLIKPIVEKIKNGTCLFIYGNAKGYKERSSIMRNS